MRVRANSVAVLGDISVETAGNLADVVFRSIDRDVLIYSPLRAEPGGSALNFALAATEWFEEVKLLGRIGDDIDGDFLLRALGSSPVRPLIEKTAQAATGRAVYLRDASGEAEKGRRLLVVDRGANRLIDSAYVERHAREIANSSVLFLDGYCFLDPACRWASELAMTIAREGGASVAFDLVPHDAHLYFTRGDVEFWISSSDFVIVEVRTIRRVFGLRSKEEVLDDATAFETLAMLREHFPALSWCLRFGPGNIEYSLIEERGSSAIIRHNSYLSSTQPRGFGDRLSAADVAGWLPKWQRKRGS